MAEDFIGEEASGVFIGELLEDMVDTVSRTGKLYCDVYIPQFFAKGYSHPLTYVPFWAFTLPLRKGDKVMVEFHQNDLTLPVLYKNTDETTDLPDFDIKQMYEKFEFGQFVTGGNVQKPTSMKTVNAQWIGKDSYIVKTDDYTVVHQNTGFILINKMGEVYVYGSQVNIVATKKVNIEGETGVEIYTNAACNITAKGSFTVNNHLKVTI